MGGRSGSVSGALLWAVTGACALAALGLAASATSAAAKPSHRLIVTPHAGRKLPARPVWIRVRAANGARHLAVRLNGEEIGRRFSARNARGVRKLQASSSFGLRHGRNRLRVRLRRADGGIRAKTIHFRIRRNKPLAGAGIDRTVAVGSRVYLSGAHSRSNLHRSALKDRWKVTRKPRSGAAAGARLVGARSKQPRFVANQPGKYVLRLRVRARDGRTGSDLVDVRVDPPPAASLDTMADGPNDATGIRVGEGKGGFYPAKPGAWAQLVALDRQTLEPVTGKIADLANKSYPCPGLRYGDPQLPKCINALQQDLNRLDRHTLAIISNPITTLHGKGTPGYGLELATTRIGVKVSGFNLAPAGLLPGSFSAIGVPGGGPANWHAVVALPGGLGEGQGEMRDYLIRDNSGDYVFAPSERPDFNTQAAGSDQNRNVIEIGKKRFTESSDTGGLQVVVVDQSSLEGTSAYYPTAGPSSEEALHALRDRLAQANEGHNLIFIASHGVPAVERNCGCDDGQRNAWLQQAADQAEKLGGTRGAFFRALDPGLSNGDSYALVGGSRYGVAQGVEMQAGQAAADRLDGAPLSGTLARTGPNYTFEVQSSQLGTRVDRDPSRGATELARVAVQPPSAWPEQGNQGRSDAIAWIGSQVLGTGNPRGQYWTVGYVNGQFDYNFWTGGDGVANRIAELTQPDPRDVSFNEDDLRWAKAELEREIGWLASTHRYFDRLSTPFSDQGLESWAELKQTSNLIRDKVRVSPDQKVIASQRAGLDFGKALLKVIPVAGKAADTAFRIYDFASRSTEVNGEPAEQAFQTRADQVGVELANRLTAEQRMLTRQLPNTIAADYEKLRTVGTCASARPADWSACPFDHSDWQFTQDDQAHAAKLLGPQLDLASYAALLPARFTLWRLPPWWRRNVGDNKDFYGVTKVIDTDFWLPFAGLPDSAQVAVPVYRNLPTYSHQVSTGSRVNAPYTSSGDSWQIYALGYVAEGGDGTIGHPWVMKYPDRSVTDRLFRDPSDGGLVADPETFLLRYFTPTPLAHYPWRDSPTGWCVYGSGAPGGYCN
jgi:hypothetical protein